MDTLSITVSTISLVGVIIRTYKTIKTIKDLPKAFDEVQKRLPIVEKTLEAVKNRLKSEPDPSDDEEAAIKPILQTCYDKATKLNKIFTDLKKSCQKDTEATSWITFRATYRKALSGLKANRVETLMHDILENLKLLAMNHVFQSVAAEDLKQIEQAISELSTVAPSLDDSEFEKGGASGIINVNDHGSAQQNNSVGDGNFFSNSSGEGHTYNFGPKS